MAQGNSWQWIRRNVEPTLEKWVKAQSCVIYVRGHRRSGKSSTVKQIALKLRKKIILFYVTGNDINDVSAAKSLLLKHNISVDNLHDIGKALVEAVRRGLTVIIEEIQNASNGLQVSIQHGIDTMAFESMNDGRQWEKASSMFLMGSLPGMVDRIMESRQAPLYERVTAKITVLPFDTLEMCRLFHNLSISSPTLMLSLHSMFGGKPYYYENAYKAGLFDGDETSIVNFKKEFFASELMKDFADANTFLEKQLDSVYCKALKAVQNGTNKKEQEAKLKECECACDPYQIIYKDLYLRYGLIEPVYDLKSFTTIVKYVITDPMILLALAASSSKMQQVKREDVQRELNIDEESFCQLEGNHLETWIREIAEDRRLLLNIPAFPVTGLSNSRVNIAPRINWDIKDCEIDLIASCPADNILFVGSCKRSKAKTSPENLNTHFNALKKSTKFNALLKELCLTNHYKVMMLHFASDGSFQSKDPDHHIISLKGMIQPFLEKVVMEEREAKKAAEAAAATKWFTACISVLVVLMLVSATAIMLFALWK